MRRPARRRTDLTERFAIYFSPRSGSDLAGFGEDWFSGRATDLNPEYQDRITAKARHYGFHATLKAPFRLADGGSQEALRQAVADFASKRKAPEAPPLALRNLDGFLALMLSENAPEVSDLAQDCVETFESFRAPLNADELARRRMAPLSERQEGNLARWGYPYVAEDFRFHMTLTARLDPKEWAKVEQAILPLLKPITCRPLKFDAVALFHQPAADAGFALVERFPLTV